MFFPIYGTKPEKSLGLMVKLQNEKSGCLPELIRINFA